MNTTASFSTFVRPPGSPVYAPSGPSLTLPRRSPSQYRLQSIREQPRVPVEMRDAATLEIRRQINQVLALIRATEALDMKSPAVEAQNDELASSLQQLEMKLADRERAVEEREYRLAERERDLAEAEVLLQHHESLLAASRRTPAARVGLSEEERFALVNLKAEIERQETLLREAREEMRQRELFVEESERRLFEKVQEQQEKETELEQREEEVRAKEPSKNTGGGPEAKRTFDEFNE